MAAIHSVSLSTIIISIIIFLSSPLLSASIPSQELDRALSFLRFRGHALFANAIATSDLLFDLLSADSLTLLGPTDPMLFALDMTHSLHFYISTLRLHAIPLRLSLSDLRTFPNATSIPTFLPSHHLLLTRPPASAPDAIDLDGIRLLLPGLYYSRHVAVHGLAAVLPFKNTVLGSPPPVNVTNPPGAPFSPLNGTVVFGPVPEPSVYNHTNRTFAPRPTLRIPRSNGSVALPPVGANKTVNQMVARPQSPNIAASPTTAPSLAPDLMLQILRPSSVAYPTVLVPAKAPSRFEDYTPTGSPQISPASSPKMAPATRNLNPPKIGEVSLVHMAFLLMKNNAQEDKIGDGRRSVGYGD